MEHEKDLSVWKTVADERYSGDMRKMLKHMTASQINARQMNNTALADKLEGDIKEVMMLIKSEEDTMPSEPEPQCLPSATSDTTEKNEIKILENLNPEKVFTKGGSQSIIDAIKEKALNFKSDVTTEKGRKEIASRAYAIARSKTFLDEAGKKLKEKYQKSITPIDEERAIIKLQLDSLRDKVRKPLTDWEEEQERIARAKAEAYAKAEEEKKQAIEAAERKKREDEEAERVAKQKAIDEENARIKADQEEKQRKIDEQNAKIEAEKKELEEEKRKLAEEKRKQEEAARATKLNKIKIGINNFVFILRNQNNIEKQFYSFEIVDWSKMMELDAVNDEGVIIPSVKSMIEDELESELQNQIAYYAKKKEDEAKAEAERIAREEEIKKQAIEDERKRVEAEKKEKARLQAIEDEKAEKIKAQVEHIENIDSEVQASLRSFFGGSDEYANGMMNFIKDGKVAHVSIKY